MVESESGSESASDSDFESEMETGTGMMLQGKLLWQPHCWVPCVCSET